MWGSDTLPSVYLGASTLLGLDSPAVYTQVRRCGGSSCDSSIQDFFDYSGSFMLPHNFRIVFSSSVKDVIDILMGTADLLFVI